MNKYDSNCSLSFPKLFKNLMKHSESHSWNSPHSHLKLSRAPLAGQVLLLLDRHSSSSHGLIMDSSWVECNAGHQKKLLRIGIWVWNQYSVHSESRIQPQALWTMLTKFDKHDTTNMDEEVLCLDCPQDKHQQVAPIACEVLAMLERKA